MSGIYFQIQQEKLILDFLCSPTIVENCNYTIMNLSLVCILLEVPQVYITD